MCFKCHHALTSACGSSDHLKNTGLAATTLAAGTAKKLRRNGFLECSWLRAQHHTKSPPEMWHKSTELGQRTLTRSSTQPVELPSDRTAHPGVQSQLTTSTKTLRQEHVQTHDVKTCFAQHPMARTDGYVRESRRWAVEKSERASRKNVWKQPNVWKWMRLSSSVHATCQPVSTWHVSHPFNTRPVYFAQDPLLLLGTLGKA